MKNKIDRVTELVLLVNNKDESTSWGQEYYDQALKLFPIRTKLCKDEAVLDPRITDTNIQRFIDYVTFVS